MREEHGGRADRLLQRHLDEERPSGVDVRRLAQGESALRGIREEHGETFGIPSGSLLSVEVVGEISALDDQRSGVQERFETSHQCPPLVGGRVPADGDGQHERIGEVMDDEREQRPDPVFVGEEGGLGDHIVPQQSGCALTVEQGRAERREEVASGNGEGGPSPVEMVRGEDDNPAVSSRPHTGESLGNQVRGQQVVRQDEAGDGVRHGLDRGGRLDRGSEEAVRVCGGKGVFPQPPKALLLHCEQRRSSSDKNTDAREDKPTGADRHTRSF